jgi:hypothetical protein
VILFKKPYNPVQCCFHGFLLRKNNIEQILVTTYLHAKFINNARLMTTESATPALWLVLLFLDLNVREM